MCDSIGIGMHGAGNCEITGLTKEEIDLVYGSIRGGHHWIRRGGDGRLEHVPSYEILPDPVVDKEMYPYWRRQEVEESIQMQLTCEGSVPDGHHPSISIQALCGYYYTEKNYQKQAELLTGYGFECFRSRRSNDGRFGEIWRLSGTFAAKGELEIAINNSRSRNEGERTKIAVEFLRTHAVFGTLNLDVQKLAMPAPD